MPPVSYPPTMGLVGPGLRFQWDYPDPLRVSYKLAELEYHFVNPYGLTLALEAEAREDMRERFLDETDPEGRPWEELKKPAKDQIGILRLTEEMYEKAMSDEAWDASRTGVYFDTSVLPKYWAFHEQPEGEGGQRIPRRSFVGLSSEYREKMTFIAEGWLEEVIDDVVEGPIVERFGASFGLSAKGEFVYGIPLGSRGFVPVGRGYGGMFVSLK